MVCPSKGTHALQRAFFSITSSARVSSYWWSGEPKCGCKCGCCLVPPPLVNAERGEAIGALCYPVLLLAPMRKPIRVGNRHYPGQYSSQSASISSCYNESSPKRARPMLLSEIAFIDFRGRHVAPYHPVEGDPVAMDCVPAAVETKRGIRLVYFGRGSE